MTYKKLQVVMLPTNRAENCFYLQNNIKLNYYRGYLTQDYLNNALNAKSFHLYVLSNEEIKEGDWVYNEISKEIYQFKQNLVSYEKKIVATTDISLTVKQYGRGEQTSFFPLPQPPDSFLELYAKEYNAGKQIKEVLVEYIYYHPSLSSDVISERLLLNKDNTITVKPIKESWSKEEVKELLNLFAEYAVYGGADTNFFNADKWIEQNL
jgi:hypothetical protein